MSVMNFGGQQDKHLPLIEFAYNNSYHVSIEMVPYEARYGRNADHLCVGKLVKDSYMSRVGTSNIRESFHHSAKIEDSF